MRRAKGVAKGVARAAAHLVEQRGGLVELRRLRPDGGVEDARQPLFELVEDQPAKRQGRNEARTRTAKPRQAKASEGTKCACVRVHACHGCTRACVLAAGVALVVLVVDVVVQVDLDERDQQVARRCPGVESVANTCERQIRANG